MSFTQDDVNKLAHLARLSISDHSIAKDLSNILQLLAEISEINTDNIEPMEHSLTSAQRCRPDIVTEPNVREVMQNLAPEHAKAAGLYLVPQVIE